MGSALEAVLQYRAQEAAQQKAQSDSILQATQLFQQARQQANENKFKQLLYQNQVQQQGITNKLAQDQFQNTVTQQGVGNKLAQTQLTDQEAQQKISNAFAESQFSNTKDQQKITNQLAQLQYTAGLAEKGLIPDQTRPGGFRYDPTLTSPLNNIIAATKLQADAKTAGNKSVYDMAGSVLGNLTNGGTIQIPQSPAITPGSALAGAIAPTAPTAPSAQSQMTPTGQTSQTDPITGLTTGTTTFTNIPAKIAENKATDIGKEQAAAVVGGARDTAQMQMVAQGLKNLNDIHKKLTDSGFAGNALSQPLADHYNVLPQSLQNKFVPSNVQNQIGKFVSARNEALVKVQPILSQQFGQAGTSRIMESLVNLSKGEFGDLSTPHSQFEGQAEGTLGSLYRIKLASDKYLEGLNKSNQPIPTDEKAVTQGIYSNMVDLTPSQEKELKGLVDSTLSRKTGYSVGQSKNIGGINYIRQKDGKWHPQS